jgi:hypothetical protein
VVAAAVLLAQAGVRHRLLTEDPSVQLSLPTAQEYRDQGKTFQTAGGVLIGVGAAFVAAAAAMFLFGAPAPTSGSAGLWLGADGAGITYGGVWP